MSDFSLKIFHAFPVYGNFRQASPYGSGHINDTYAATVSQSGTLVRHLFQRINNRVFIDVPGLMDNVQTDYMQGDTYFKVKRENHNLDRCRTEFALVNILIEQDEVFQNQIQSQTIYSERG